MTIQAAELPSNEERELIRRAVAGLLEEHWPLDSMEKAVERASQPGTLKAIYLKLAELGLTSLGSNPAEGGLREILLVTEEIGRRGIPSPFFGAALCNILLRDSAGESSDLLSKIHGGEMILSTHLGQLDGDMDSGSVKIVESSASGCLKYVEDTAYASHLLFYASPEEGWGIVALNDPAVSITELPGMAYPALAELQLDRAPVTFLAGSDQKPENVARFAKLVLTARALGAASRGFELLVDYAKEREQFGQAIGRFQAVQHKLADNMIRLEGVRLCLGNAAEAFDFGDASWPVYASAAHALASPALRQVSLENHHVFGAIGYSEEHEAAHQFKRIHSDMTRQGGAAASREELAAFLLDQGNDMPDYDLGEAGNKFRATTQQWLAENWPASDPISFAKAAGEQGYFQVTWPKTFGGMGASPLEQLAFIEECERAGVPQEALISGEIQAHALMVFGTTEQQEEFLPQIAAGELTFCLGYSEPGSGSDLASLKTTAVLDGDEWVINGQKIWTTLAEDADYMWLAARTNPDAVKPHAGVSVFLVPMNTPGITIRPSMALYGKTFCQEFLDDVRVPRSALVGELDGGWMVIMAALATERVIMGGFVSQVREKFRCLVEAVRKHPGNLRKNATVRNEIGKLAGEIEASRQLNMGATRIMEEGGIPIHEASMSGVFNSELMERLGETALDILGNACTLHDDSPGAIPGELERMLRQAIMMVVGGGTNEIQRNLIAQRGLGLPR